MAKKDDDSSKEGNDKKKKPRKKNPKAGKSDRAKRTKGHTKLNIYHQAPLKPIPTLNLQSEGVDYLLSRMIRIVYITLIDIEKIAAKNIKVEEFRNDSTFLYLFENTKLGIIGYVSRAADGNIKFLAMDQARFKWAVEEGFIPNAKDIEHRQFVYDKIGVLRELTALMDFIKFIAGRKDYVFTGDYLLTEKKQDEID